MQGVHLYIFSFAIVPRLNNKPIYDAIIVNNLVKNVLLLK